MSVCKAILRGADAIDARDAFDPELRKEFMNASEAMGCIRKQFYQKNDAQTDGPEDWGYARRGKMGERYIVECLRAANTPMLFTGKDQVKIADTDVMVAATPDGLILNDAEDGWIACEFKTIDPRTNRSKLPRVPHVTQVQLAAALFNKHADDFPEMQGLPVTGCLIVYMDASNYNDLIEIPVPAPPSKLLDSMAGRAKRLLNSKDASRLPREGKTNGECNSMCNHTGVCGVQGAEKRTVASGAGALTEKRVAYLSAKESEAAAKAMKDAAAEEIKSLLRGAGVPSMDVDSGSVSLATRAGSVAYAQVVKTCCPDVDLEPFRGKPSEVLTVK